MGIDPSIWLNQIKAVPTFGIQTEPTFDSAVSLLPKLKGVLAKWGAKYDVKISFEDHLQLKIERSDGLHIGVSNENMYVKFFYIRKVLEKALLDPVVEYSRPATPYVELKSIVREAFREVVTDLYRDANRTITRIGIVAEGNLDPDALPPGVSAYFEYLAAPWGTGEIESHGSIVGTLAKSGTHTDKCHHLIVKAGESQEPVPCKLDWQRYFEPKVTPNVNKLMELIDECSKDSLEYFGRFGIGELDYARK